MSEITLFLSITSQGCHTCMAFLRNMSVRTYECYVDMIVTAYEQTS
jgi:hypothetical protein